MILMYKNNRNLSCKSNNYYEFKIISNLKFMKISRHENYYVYVYSSHITRNCSFKFNTYITVIITDPLSVIINEEEICTTSITISLNTHSHPSCGEVSHNVTISGNVVYPDTVSGSQYTIGGLQSDTLYNITVTSTHNGSIRILNKDVRTIMPVCKF